MALFRKKAQKVAVPLTPHSALKTWLDKGFFNPTCQACSPSTRYHEWHELLPLITPVAQALLACPQLELDPRGEELLHINTAPLKPLPAGLERLAPEGDLQWEGLALAGDVLRDLRLFFRDASQRKDFMVQICIRPHGLVEYTLLMSRGEGTPSRSDMMRSTAGISREPYMTGAYSKSARDTTAPSLNDVQYVITHLPAYLAAQ